MIVFVLFQGLFYNYAKLKLFLLLEFEGLL